MFQTLARPSSLPVSRNRPSAEKLTALTLSSWPRIGTKASLPVAVAQTQAAHRRGCPPRQDCHRERWPGYGTARSLALGHWRPSVARTPFSGESASLGHGRDVATGIDQHEVAAGQKAASGPKRADDRPGPAFLAEFPEQRQPVVVHLQ